MPRLNLLKLTGGLVNADSGRADQLADNQVQKSDNYEIIGDGSRLTIRKNAAQYGAKSGDDLDDALDAVFDTSVNWMSEPYYPTRKPTGMTGDAIFLFFGVDGGVYKLYRAWETSTTFSVSQISITGITYTSSSDMKFFVGEDRVIITDYINRAHYYRINNEGTELSGVLGIPAPLNPASFTQLTTYAGSDFEENAGNNRLSDPGLVQVVYVAVTKNGDMSNPSPISNTLRMQRFRVDTVGADEKWIDVVKVNNLSIPVTGSGSDVESQLKWFDIYLRVMRYSEDAPSNFEFSERVLIVDKSNTSGETGNDYALTVPVTLGQNPSTENDVAPVAKVASQVGGVTALGGIKTKITFPFAFSRYKKIIIQNKDGKSYVDAVVKIRLFDEDHSDGDAIAGLNWDDYDTNGDDDIDSGNINKIRFYDGDLTTALNVVYTLDTSADWCDVYIKIPLLIPGNRIIYLTFGSSKGSDTEILNNGNFGSDASNWTLGSGWTWNSGAIDVLSGDVIGLQQIGGNQKTVIVIGKTYEVTFTVSNYVSGTVTPRVGSAGIGTTRSGDGTYTENIVAAGDTSFYIYGGSGGNAFTGTVDSISCKLIELEAMVGVDDANMQTIPNGKWHHAGVTSWSAQTVFQPEMVKSSNSIALSTFDFQDANLRMPNLVNEKHDPVLSNAIFTATEVAAIPDLGDTFVVGSGSVKMSTNAGFVHYAGDGTITAQANGGSGFVTHTSAAHKLKVGEIIEIEATTSYDGIFTVVSVTTDTFNLEQTWVANDAAGSWRRGQVVFPERGYLYSRITYAGSDVTITKDIFAIEKNTSLRLRINGTGFFWQINGDFGSTDFTKLSAAANTSGTGKYFVLLSWDQAAGTISLFIYDMTNGTLEFEELSESVEPDERSNLRLGNSSTTIAIPNANYSQCQLVEGTYFDGSVLADANTVRNIANFMPAFENLIGESLAADNVDDGVMDVAVAASTAGTNWTTNADWDVNTTTANKAHCAAAGLGATLAQTSNPSIAGEKYLVKYTISGIAAGGVNAEIGGIGGTSRTANGTYVEVITASNTNALKFKSAAGGFTGDIDDVIVYPLSYNNNVDYSTAVKAITEKEEGNLLKWSGVNGISFPDLNFKFLREPIEAIIPAPSFLKFNYENTFVIYMRNFINRFVLDGDPSLLSARTDVLIEERTNFGLQYANSLTRAGEDLFWKSEAGMIHWSPEGLLLISDGVISIADIGGSGDMFGFYSPIRNQYLLHNRLLNTYVYDIKRKVFTQFTGISMKSKPVTLTAGTAADNVNLFLDENNNVDLYPGTADTSVAAEIRTKEFLMGKGLLNKIIGDYSEIAGTVLSVVVKNVDYAGGQKETTLTKEPLVWRHIDYAKKRGRSFYIKLKNVTDFSYFRIDYTNIGGRD